jgi:hypothetical protein
LEVALYDASGSGADYVQFFGTFPGPLADRFRNNPADVYWLTGPVFRAPLGTSLDVIRRVPFSLSPVGYFAFGISGDWVAESGPGTPGAPNPSYVFTGPTILFPGVDLGISNPAPGTIDVRILTGHASVSGVPPAGGNPVITLFSLIPTVCAGSGSLFGLEPDLLGLLLAIGSPFVDVLDYAGTHSFTLSGLLPGVAFEARCGVVLLPTGALFLSDFAYGTT